MKVKKYKPIVTPTLLQMEAVECGAACLGIVLGYNNKFVPLEQLRQDCGVSRDGANAANIVSAAQKYGLNGEGYSVEADSLNQIPVPAIIHWNFNHFIVLEGIRGKKVFINDPGEGRKVIAYKELDESFTGVVLTFEKTDDFQKSGSQSRVFPSIKKRLAKSKVALLFLMLVGLALVIPGLIIPTFSRIFIDDILVNGKNEWIKPLILGIGVTAIIRGILVWLQQHYLLKLQIKLSVSNSSQFLYHIFKLPIGFFMVRYVGDIISRIDINNRMAGLLSGRMASTVIDFAMIIFFGFLLFDYSPELTLVGILFAFINIYILRRVGTKRKAQNQKLQQEQGKVVGVYMEGLKMIETLKATASETLFFEKWSGFHAKMMNYKQEFSRSTYFLNFLTSFLNQLNTVIILSLGSWQVMQGEMSIGMLVAFQSLMANFQRPVNNLVSMGESIQTLDADVRRLDDVLKYKQEHVLDKLNKEIRKLEGYLQLKSVSFGYNQVKPPILNDLNLKIKPGQRIAIVGHSGSGKSTAAKIVAGLYKPWSGELLLDNQSRSRYLKIVLTSSISMVDQNIFLYEGKVSENISLWDSTIPESHIINAAKDACIHDDIMTLKEGYQSTIEEDGRNFSGGQKQRIEIARALSINPSLIILDEATSALDPQIEKEIIDNIKKRGCSCLIVAHRLSTIRDCDEIIVLDNGKTVERGTHYKLMKNQGAYYQLISNH